MILEIKCLDSARDLTPEEGILEGKIAYLIAKKDDRKNFSIKKLTNTTMKFRVNFHYTDRSECLFVVFTEKEPYIWFEYIQRDANFYK